MSRINTKALLGYFGYVKDILNDFRVPKVIFVTIQSFCRVVSQGRMAARGGFAVQSAMADRKSGFFSSKNEVEICF